MIYPRNSKVFVTGGAGFIGSHLVDRLIDKGFKVTVYDNFSSGKREYLKSVSWENLRIIEGDVLNLKKLKQAMSGSNIIFHMSANADVRRGLEDTRLDLEQETIATYNVLESMKQERIGTIVFPSSMTVYGQVKTSLVSEAYGPTLPISMYGAAKLSCESLISAFCYSFGINGWIMRFANVVGSRATHGVIYDLINKLKINKTSLHVLGDGYQNKPYIYINDALEGMLFTFERAKDSVNLFNVGTEDTISVRDIVSIIIKKMKLNTKVKYDKTPYGWKGDVPRFSLDVSRIKKLGFSAELTSRQAIERAVEDKLNEIHR